MTPVRPASEVVVLVVPANSPVTSLDSVSVRKLFLGLPVFLNGNVLHPLRNRSDPRLDEIFLQQVVAMSQSSYDRQILNAVNRQGAFRPTEFSSMPALFSALAADPDSVSYMWQSEVGHNGTVRVIRVLWSD